MNRTRSESLFEEALKYIPGGVNSPVRAFRGVGGKPFFAQKAEGSRVWDEDGNSYLDYVCTWGPSILGHADPSIFQAIQSAAKNGVSFGIPTAREGEMAKKVCEWVPSVEKVRMTSSGTEATMSAIRLARGFTKRDKLIKFEGCYHGHVDSLLVKAGSGGLTLGQPDSAGIPLALAELTITLPYNDLDAVKAALEKYKDEVAALIVEPVPGNVGLILPLPGYLEGLRKLTRDHGVVLIFDEVMTGFRLAKGGVQELYGITPDLSTFGKVIGGGLPVGAFGGRREIMDYLAPLGPVYQAGTLSGNPLAMAAGLAQLEQLEARNGFQRLEELGQILEDRVLATLKRKGCRYVWNRMGSMFSLFFTEGPVRNLDEVMKCDRERFSKYFHLLLDAGIYLAPSQFEAGFISLAHTPEDLEWTAGEMEKALEKVIG
ncbi:MAG: glutamate-1-semialdehyde 2,1-aminomutase [Verrucomicrobiota bacterium]